MNNVVIIGRLVKDVELRYTSNNISIATFTLAVNRNYKSENGSYETDFINCKAFRDRADLIEKYTKKGDLIAISGSIRTGSYEKEDKSKVYTTEVIVENVKFLQSKQRVEEQQTQSYESFKSDEIVLDDSDLPF